MTRGLLMLTTVIYIGSRAPDPASGIVAMMISTAILELVLKLMKMEKEMVSEVKLRSEIAVLRKALHSISNLWPEPPHCAEVNPKWVGPNDGKLRAILLEAALKIARAALAQVVQL